MKDGTELELMYPNGNTWNVLVKKTKAYRDVTDDDVEFIKVVENGWQLVEEWYAKENKSPVVNQPSALAELYTLMYSLSHTGGLSYFPSFGRNIKTYGSKAVHRISPDSWKQITAARPTTLRNDPCPCGSGKKFKKCCIGKWEKEHLVEKK